jgi:MFS family permease
MALSALSTPFYVLHATINLGHGEAAAGVLIVSMTVGGAASYLVWGRMGDARGTRIVLLAGSVLLASVPASALLAGLWRTLPTSMITFGILGMANAAIHIGVTSYLLDHAESQSRPVYVATTHIIVGVLGTSPFLGGIIAGRVGYAPLFTISFVLAACSVLFALRLPEPRGIAEKRFRTLVRLA